MYMTRKISPWRRRVPEVICLWIFLRERGVQEPEEWSWLSYVHGLAIFPYFSIFLSYKIQCSTSHRLLIVMSATHVHLSVHDLCTTNTVYMCVWVCVCVCMSTYECVCVCVIHVCVCVCVCNTCVCVCVCNTCVCVCVCNTCVCVCVCNTCVCVCV